MAQFSGMFAIELILSADLKDFFAEVLVSFLVKFINESFAVSLQPWLNFYIRSGYTRHFYRDK